MMTNSCSGENRASGSKGSEDGGGCGEMKLKGNVAMVLKKGPWTAAEDAILREYVEKQGEGNWNAVQKNSGLARCGKSCRLRWANHLRPNLKKGSFSPDEERLILELHSKIGNKWARMAAQLPGRTDNEIKNYWNTRVKRRLRQGLPLYPHDIHLNTSPYHHHHDHSENTQTQTQNLLSASPPPPHSLSFFDGAAAATNNSQPSSPRFFTPITPTLLTSNRYKRFRSSGSVDFQLPLSSIPSLSSNLGQNLQTQFQQHHHHPSSSSSHSPSPSPFDQSMFHLPHISSFSVDSATFDQNSHQLFLTQFNPPSKNDQTAADGEDGGGFVSSLKPELPSSQFFQTTTMQDDTYKEDMKMEMMNSVGRNGNNGGLLDDLLREAQAISRMNSEQDVYVAHWEDSSSVHSSSGMKRRVEQGADHINLMHEDLSNYLNIIPPSMQVPLWFTDRREISNGQSSGATDDNLGGIDENVQQLTSPLPITTPNWDNMPRIY